MNVLLFLVSNLYNKYIYSINSKFSQKWIIIFIIGTVGSGVFQIVQCNQYYKGRYVAIYFDHPGVLTVCEFEVYGGKFC